MPGPQVWYRASGHLDFEWMDPESGRGRAEGPGVTVSGKRHTCGLLVLARGAWCPRILELSGNCHICL